MLAILILHVPQCISPSFDSIWLTIQMQMWFEVFQDGCRGDHLGYWNRTILAILNLYVASMPPTKFLLNPTFGVGGDVFWRISKWPPSWISVWNYFSNSESSCPLNASYQVSTQSDLSFERSSSLNNFKMASMAVILDIEMQRFKQFWISM